MLYNFSFVLPILSRYSHRSYHEFRHDIVVSRQIVHGLVKVIVEETLVAPVVAWGIFVWLQHLLICSLGWFRDEYSRIHCTSQIQHRGKLWVVEELIQRLQSRYYALPYLIFNRVVPVAPLYRRQEIQPTSEKRKITDVKNALPQVLCNQPTHLLIIR